jgi:hypothetical protein
VLFVIALFGPGIFICISHLYKDNIVKVGNVSETVTAVASAITAIVAVIAIGVAIRQIGVSNRATALDTYREYLNLAIEHPDLSRRDKQEVKKSVSHPEYDAFVTYLLFAAEEVLTLFSNDEKWRNALKLDLSHHKDYFNSDAYKEDAGSYTKELQALIKEILSEKKEEKKESRQGDTGNKG